MSASTTGIFEAYSRYYELLYQDKDYDGEVEYIIGLLEQNGIGGRQLLELGSGTGKHGSLLARRGYRVHGVERSAEMIAQVTPTDGFTCEQADIADFTLDRTFDAALALFHVMSYQIDNTTVRSVFDRVSEHLEPGGLFVFDFWYSPAIYSQRPAVRVKRIGEAELEVTRVAEPVMHPNENRVDVNYTIFVCDLSSGTYETLRETHRMRHFSLPELKMVCLATGFEWITAEEFLTGHEPGEDTWGVCVVVRKT